MNKAIKQLVSKKKRRYIADGFDLDLTYVTDRVIAMGFPSESMESLYRNSLDEVRRFLEAKHHDHYKIYNLCSERSYDVQKFHGRVAVYPFDDHSPPEFGQILPFCCDVGQWLDENSRNVAVVHCKAGKGRTGLMICAFLLYSKTFKTAEDVLSFYGSARTFDSNGVTIPSQKRYVDYFATKLEKGLLFEYSPVKLLLKCIVINAPPHVGFGNHSIHLQFEVIQPLVPPFLSEVYTLDLDKKKIFLELENPILLSGDVKISFIQKMNVDLLHLGAKPKFFSNVPNGKLFHFWINTYFIDLQHSSKLSHDLAKVIITKGATTKFPSLRKLPSSVIKKKAQFQRGSFSRGLLCSTPTTRNRFAALSMPNLPAEFEGENNASMKRHEQSSDSSDDTSQEKSGTYATVSGCEMSVRLRKDQIDKASKDTSGRFQGDFAVTLVVFKKDD